MADNKIVAGGRDDLDIDSSRCMRMRFSESGCRRCMEICPHGAVTLDSGLAIRSDLCRGCLLCTAVCPVGALEQRMDFAAILLQLSRVPEPVLGCVRTTERSHASLSCLGGLAEEHLLTLFHTVPGRLTLNLSLCADCPNSPVIPSLKQRLDAIANAGSRLGGCRAVIAESVQELHYRDESVDRRSFFKSFGHALLKNAQIILSSTDDQHKPQTEYALKRVPIRRELLNKTRAGLSRELADRVREHFDSCVSFDENCTRCHGCVAICPTAALQTDLTDTLPKFDQLLCTGCGLCEEFCLDGAVRISSERI